MSWSFAQVSNSTVWLAGLPDGATAWVKVCQAAMSDDCPQGSFSLTASAEPHQTAPIAAKAARRRSIVPFPRRRARACISRFNFVIRIAVTLLRRRDGRSAYSRLFPLEIGPAFLNEGGAAFVGIVG